MAKGWSDFTANQRRLIVFGATVEAALKIAMLVDLARRPASQVRGRKWLWASGALVNSAGALPVVYFAFGRRPHRLSGSDPA